MGGFIKLNAVAGSPDLSLEVIRHQEDDGAANRARPLYKKSSEYCSNNAGEMLDNESDRMDDAEEYQPDLDEPNEEVDQAVQGLEQICRYSHKILKKYVVNGNILLKDGPLLHHLVDQRDCRIICILEVFSQNKNEEDFLENLGLLTQVIKE